MVRSVLDAIKIGEWDFEPKAALCDQYDSTKAMPGTDEKVVVLAERARQGLPLWHPFDRRSYDEQDRDKR